MVHAVGMAPTERLKLRRQMAAAAGKKRARPPCLCSWKHAALKLKKSSPSTVATPHWAEGVWTGKWSDEQKEAWMRQIRRGPNVEASERDLQEQ